MKARTVRSDMHYEVAFSRPAFSRIASFFQIIEPIYDAFSSELVVPSDAISLQNGTTIATSGVTLSLFSGLSVFEAKLDGYKAHLIDLRSSEAINQAKRHVRLFEDAVSGFLTDSVRGHSRLMTPSWITLQGGAAAAKDLVRTLTWLPDSDDPFQIGATNTRSLVKFECLNDNDRYKIGITVDKSALPEADLFLELSGEYSSDSHFCNFDDKVTHLANISRTVIDKLDITME
ncbi:MAG: hypothetical protein OXC68_06100 [Aestuariivita sp.]|nr:hypothetical protein [Aestuariivita sp.]